MDELNRFNDLHGLTIAALLRRRAQQHPFKLALSAQSWRGHRDRLSFAQLVIRMDSVARGLAVRGLQRGERVALFLSNDAVREGVIDVRVKGAIGVIEMNTDAENNQRLRQEFIARGVWLRPFGNALYLMPSLIINDAELESIFSAIDAVLA